MTTTSNSIAHRFATAFGTRDVERVVDVFTPDVVYHDLFYGTVTGHAGVRDMFGRMYAEGSRHLWVMTSVAVGERHTTGEWTFQITLGDNMEQGAGRTLWYPGVSVFETRDGRCHTYREYFDRTAALLGAGLAPDSVAAIVRRRSSVRVTLPAPDILTR